MIRKTGYLALAGLVVLVIGMVAGSSAANGQTSGMVAYWKFEEGQGDVAADSVGLHVATLHGGPTWTTQGQVGGALSFDGYNDYLSISHSPDLNASTSGFSLSLWVRASSEQYSGDNHFLFVDKSHGSDGAGWVLQGSTYNQNTAGSVAFMIGTGTGWPGTSIAPPSLVLDDLWHHIAGTFNGVDTFGFYLDGVLRNSKTLQGGVTPKLNSRGVFIGAWRGLTRHYHGLMDEVAIFNRGLTADEVRMHYENGLLGLGYDETSVTIDIKPGSYPNSVNLGSNGVVPVAILSTADFDATAVDPETVELAGAGVGVRGKGNKFLSHIEEVDGDGYLDLLVQVDTENLEPGTFQDGYACLTGETYDGGLVEGWDEITIVPPE